MVAAERESLRHPYTNTVSPGFVTTGRRWCRQGAATGQAVTTTAKIIFKGLQVYVRSI